VNKFQYKTIRQDENNEEGVKQDANSLMCILHMLQHSAIQAHTRLSYSNHCSFCQHPTSIYDYIHVTVWCVTRCNKVFSVFL